MQETLCSPPHNIADDVAVEVHLKRRQAWKAKIKVWSTFLVKAPLYLHHNVAVNEDNLKHGP